MGRVQVRNEGSVYLRSVPYAGTLRFRVRLLQLTEEHILADYPASVDAETRIPTGRPITVHISLNGVRYQFESAIEVAGTFVRLNKQQRVLGVALKRPTDVTRSQRRSNLRVSLMGIDPATAKLVCPHPNIPGACKVDAEVLTGRLVDLSAGGAAVLVEGRSLTAVPHNQLYFVSFALPGLEEEFCLLGAVRHTRFVQARGSLRIGLAFRSWVGSNLDRDQRTLTRFVTRHERRLLRRRK